VQDRPCGCVRSQACWPWGVWGGRGRDGTWEGGGRETNASSSIHPPHHQKKKKNSPDKQQLGAPLRIGDGCSFRSFTTNNYKLHALESPSGLKVRRR
jgi:hypothetical protein